MNEAFLDGYMYKQANLLDKLRELATRNTPQMAAAVSVASTEDIEKKYGQPLTQPGRGFMNNRTLERESIERYRPNYFAERAKRQQKARQK
jgi:hypothetical protein